MRPLVHITGIAVRSNADLLQCGDRRGRPGRAGLAVARQRFNAKNSPHVRRSTALAPRKLSHAIEQAAVGEIFRGRRMDGMKIGVVTDVVLLQRGNHVAPTAPLEHTRLFTDELERGADAPSGEHFPVGRASRPSGFSR